MIRLKASESDEFVKRFRVRTNQKVTVNGQTVYVSGGTPMGDTVILIPGGRRLMWDVCGRVYFV